MITIDDNHVSETGLIGDDIECTLSIPIEFATARHVLFPDYGIVLVDEPEHGSALTEEVLQRLQQDSALVVDAFLRDYPVVLQGSTHAAISDDIYQKYVKAWKDGTDLDLTSYQGPPIREPEV